MPQRLEDKLVLNQFLWMQLSKSSSDGTYDVTLSGFTELLLTQLQNQGQMNFTVRLMLFQKSRSNW
jgi:hypothetical protein